MSDPAPNNEERLLALLVSHTHWDREWYLPAGRFQQRLVRLIDELLDDAPSPYLLDGQAVVLDDYLAVRPERASELSDRLQSGALEAGPWYVLADELIPSGEALVRNLLAGRRTLARLGASAPPVLYCPDSFGHPAALPSLAAGFGLPMIIAWRGYGGRRWPAGDTVRWRASDGSEALLLHLSRDGYELASHLPVDDASARERWHAMRDVLGPRSRTGVLFLPHGADHHARQLQSSDAIAALERAAAPVPVQRATLRELATTVAARVHVAESREPRAESDVPFIEGELRDSAGYVWSLQGTFATRAAQKRRNALVERTLLREAEPQAALARLAGASSSRALVQHAWRALLLCHPHDTLCGCSTDEVARAMDARLDDALAQARGLRDDAIANRLGHDSARAHARRDAWRPTVVVRNASARARGGVAELIIDEFVADEAVGPGSVPPTLTTGRSGATPSLGAHVPMQSLGVRRVRRRIESERHYPDNDLVDEHRVLAWLEPVDALGLTLCHSDRSGRLSRAARGKSPGESLRHSERSEEPPARGATHAIATSRGFLASLGTTEVVENDALRLAIDADGRVTLTTRDGLRRVDDLIAFEDVDDFGDLYTHSPFGAPRTNARFLGARLVHAGPLRAELESRWSLDVAAAGLQLTLSFILDAGAEFLRVHIAGDNGTCDHRLRLVLRTDVANGETWADAAFGPVRRVALDVADDDRRIETPPPTAPLHRYVSRFAADRGATLYADGLAEYESLADGAIAVTLVRAVGQLSRNDLPERPGHAGWPTDTPEAQSLGPFDASFAIAVHGARDDATIDRIERLADEVLLPLVGVTVRDAIHLPPRVPGVALDGAGLAFTTLKESDDGEWIVARCVNLLEHEVEGAWLVPSSVREAHRARLDETPLEAVAIGHGRIAFVAASREIVTVLLR